jgi:predicted kinase
MSATLHVIFGPSGAGKSSYAQNLARREPAVHFAIDDWMARLFVADMPDPIEFTWVMERVERCETQIWSVAAGVMAAGTSVVLDLGLTRKGDRARVAEIAQACDLPVQFHFVTAPRDIRRARVLARNEVKGETFSMVVTPQTFDFMEGIYEAPDAEELAGVIISEST